VKERWVLAINFGVAVFHDGHDVKHGSRLDFRSGMKTRYDISNNLRIGLEFSHLSNGSLADKNPGTELVFLSLSFPL
jgi:hypothetical protein